VSQQSILLTDTQLQSYIQNGYIILKSSRPAELHQQIFDKMETIFEKEGNPGNNMVPRIPEIQEIFTDPVIHGTLTSINGPNYYVHPHRHPHLNRPRSSGQNLHKDSWSKLRHHTRWTMALYYPQDTPVETGPTGVTPGSHYLNAGSGEADEVPLHGAAGTVVIVHYDLWHRAMPNQSNHKRYMLKFLFTRMEEPQPSPRNQATAPGSGKIWDTDDPLYSAMWRWHMASDPQPSRKTNGDSVSIQDLHHQDEAQAIRAAYQLSEMGQSAIPDLLSAVRDPDGIARQNATYGLAAMGAAAVDLVAELIAHEDPAVRISGIETLGDLGRDATDALDQLIKTAVDDDPAVRRASSDALGLVGQRSTTAVSALAENLKDDDVWVKRNASLALARLGELAESAMPSLITALKDENRYVRANSLEALRRIGTSASETAMFNFLLTSRWCPLTTRDSTF
jgi:hypothetical protein